VRVRVLPPAQFVSNGLEQSVGPPLPEWGADESLSSSIGKSCVEFRPALVDSGGLSSAPEDLHGLTATNDLNPLLARGSEFESRLRHQLSSVD
jgi:hypothetical protein